MQTAPTVLTGGHGSSIMDRFERCRFQRRSGFSVAGEEGGRYLEVWKTGSVVTLPETNITRQHLKKNELLKGM